MSEQLKDELKQTRPWSSLEEEVVLNIARTAAVLEHEFAQLLKRFEVTPTQYNVLRILRGAGSTGLCRNEVGERLIRTVPDVTRLLDRMEEMALITRRRDEGDRRFVTTVITDQGLGVLAELDALTTAFHRDRLAHLADDQKRTIIDVLEAVRRRS